PGVSQDAGKRSSARRLEPVAGRGPRRGPTPPTVRGRYHAVRLGSGAAGSPHGVLCALHPGTTTATGTARGPRRWQPGQTAGATGTAGRAHAGRRHPVPHRARLAQDSPQGRVDEKAHQDRLSWPYQAPLHADAGQFGYDLAVTQDTRAACPPSVECAPTQDKLTCKPLNLSPTDWYGWRGQVRCCT